MANADFAKKIVNSVLENGLVEQTKQEIYESCHTEVQQAAENIKLMTKRIMQLEAEKINELKTISMLWKNTAGEIVFTACRPVTTQRTQ